LSTRKEGERNQKKKHGKHTECRVVPKWRYKPPIPTKLPISVGKRKWEFEPRGGPMGGMGVSRTLGEKGKRQSHRRAVVRPSRVKTPGGTSQEIREKRSEALGVARGGKGEREAGLTFH